VPDRRWLSPEAAADYLDVRTDALPRLVRAGRIPAPAYFLGPRQPRYDRLKLDSLAAAAAPSHDPDSAVERLLEKAVARKNRAA
jgi:hypothetical protein